MPRFHLLEGFALAPTPPPPFPGIGLFQPQACLTHHRLPHTAREARPSPSCLHLCASCHPWQAHGAVSSSALVEKEATIAELRESNEVCGPQGPAAALHACMASAGTPAWSMLQRCPRPARSQVPALLARCRCVQILETKVRKLEQLVKLKDAKITTIMARLQQAGLA